MKIVIYGLSASGKTAVATSLAKTLGYDIRSCGEEVKAKTIALGLQSPSALPLSVHKEIDSETKRIAYAPGLDIVIEGRYLNYILLGYEQALFVKLTCRDDIREVRIAKKLFGNKDTIENRDNEYHCHKRELYGDLKSDPRNSISIDTSQLTIDQCVQRIIQEIDKLT